MMLSATNTCPWLHSAFVIRFLLFAFGKGEGRGSVGGIGGKDEGIREDFAHFCDGRRRENSNYLNSAQTTSIQLKVLEITSKSSMIGSWQWAKHLFYFCIFLSSLSILCFFEFYFGFCMSFSLFFVFLFSFFLCLFSFWFSFYLAFFISNFDLFLKLFVFARFFECFFVLIFSFFWLLLMCLHFFFFCSVFSLCFLFIYFNFLKFSILYFFDELLFFMVVLFSLC